MRIFFGLNITLRVAISKVVLSPLIRSKDADAKEYPPLPVKSKKRAGILEVIAPTQSSLMTKFGEWNKVRS